MKKLFCVLMIVLLLAVCSFAAASSIAESSVDVMQVVNCNEWVSLRAEPSTSSNRVAKVPLGAIVTNCSLYDDEFCYCEYNGKCGYIMIKYLDEVSSYSYYDDSYEDNYTAETGPASQQYYQIALRGTQLVNVNLNGYTLLATRDDSGESETLNAGLFDSNRNPVWGYRTTVNTQGQYYATEAYYTADANSPYLVISNRYDVIVALDIWSGTERWRLDARPFCGVNCFGVARDGTLYVSGNDPAMLTAVSLTGELLWQTDPGSSDLYWPYMIDVYDKAIVVHYDVGGDNSHHVVGYSPAGVKLWHDLRYHND